MELSRGKLIPETKNLSSEVKVLSDENSVKNFLKIVPF